MSVCDFVWSCTLLQTDIRQEDTSRQKCMQLWRSDGYSHGQTTISDQNDTHTLRHINHFDLVDVDSVYREADYIAWPEDNISQIT